MKPAVRRHWVTW